MNDQAWLIMMVERIESRIGDLEGSLEELHAKVDQLAASKAPLPSHYPLPTATGGHVQQKSPAKPRKPESR